MRISDWSSDVCSSDLRILVEQVVDAQAKVVLYAAIRVAEAEADEGIERQPAIDAEHVPVLAERRTGVVETADVVAAQAGVHALEIGRASCRERVCPYV